MTHTLARVRESSAAIAVPITPPPMMTTSNTVFNSRSTSSGLATSGAHERPPVCCANAGAICSNVTSYSSRIDV